MKSIISLTLGILLLVNMGYGLDVYESSLSKKSVVVLLSADDVARARVSYAYANQLGAETAWRMIRLAGIPESVSGKVAGTGVWAVLTAKYGADIYYNSKNLGLYKGRERSVSLKYRVDLAGVRRVWSASGYADKAMPGSKGTKKIVNIVNTLINSSLK